jgi:hypothetical protein
VLLERRSALSVMGMSVVVFLVRLCERLTQGLEGKEKLFGDDERRLMN